MKIKNIRDYMLNNVASFISDELFLKIAYRLKLGKSLNVIDPQTFTEKLQWSKLNHRDELLTKCCDKYLVREYVADKIGSEYLIPLIGYYSLFDDIDFSNLPSKFVMKGVHGSGMNYIVHDSKSIDYKQVRSDFKRWLSFNQFYHSREWQYKNVRPGIVIEKMLLDDEGNIPNDIKIHCFRDQDGNVKNILQIDVDRFGEHKQNYYDSEWNILDLSFTNNNFKVTPSQKSVPRPKNLDEMLRIATKLSEDFPYVRVDLFTVGNKIYFGELTFHHQSGLTKPSGDWDVKLGEMLHF